MTPSRLAEIRGRLVGDGFGQRHLVEELLGHIDAQQVWLDEQAHMMSVIDQDRASMREKLDAARGLIYHLASTLEFGRENIGLVMTALARVRESGLVE